MFIEIILMLMMAFFASIPWLVILGHWSKLHLKKDTRVFLLFLWIGLSIILVYLASANFRYIFGYTFENGLLHVLGGIILLAGSYVCWRAAKDLGMARLMGSSEFSNTKERLISHGVYKHARHPRHAGYPLCVLGLGLLFGYYSVIFFGVYLFSGFAIASYVEEKELLDRYGKQYRTYRKKTGPFLILLSFSAWYVLLLFTHLLHIIEEYVWEAPFIEWYGPLWYIILEIVFFLLSLSVAFFALNGKSLGIILAKVYALIMIIDGLYHLTSWFVYSTYVGGGAGSFTAMAMVYIAGTLLCEVPRKGN